MNNILIKTLNILIKNVEKYMVTVYHYEYIDKQNYDIDYYLNDIKYKIVISSNGFWLSLSNNCKELGHQISSKYTDDITKAEIMLLAEKLKSSCKDYVSTKFRSFIDNENNINNNGIDD